MAKTRQREEKKRKLASAKKTAAMSGQMFDRPSLNIPSGCSVHGWTEAGTYRYNFIGYVLKANHNNPEAKAQGLGEGDVFFRRRYWTHRQQGEGNDTFTCLKLNFGKPCPGCEARISAIKEYGADSEEAKSHKPKLRELYNHEDTAEPDKGVQVFEYSQFGFGELLDTKINSADDDDDVEFFFDVGEQGKTVKVTAVKGKFAKFFPAADIEFKSRKEHPGEEALEKAWNLDDMVKEISYAEFKKKYNAPPADVPKDEDADTEPEDDDGDDAPPARTDKKRTDKPKAAPKQPDADDDDDDDGPPPRSEKAPTTKPSAAGKMPSRPATTTDDDDDDLDSDLEPADQAGDDDGEPVEFQVDDEVQYKDPKTKKLKEGVIAELNDKNEIAGIEVEGMSKLQWVDYADLTLLEPEPEDEPEPPARTGKKPAGKTPPKAKAPEPDDDDLDDDDSELEPVELDDDDDEPRKKPATGKKPAGR